jgi:Hint domain
MKATGSFDDESGTDAVTHTLNNGNTGKVASGATLSTSTGNPSVTFGNGATSLTNSGTIVATGDRALDASKLSKGSSIAVTNNAGAKILGSYPATGASGENNDAFKISDDFSGGSVTVNNSGDIVAGAVNGSNQIVLASGAVTSGQALDFDDVQSSLVTINNYAGGVIGAADSDAIRPGSDAIIYNDGTIIAQNASSSSSGNDGIDFSGHSTPYATGSLTITNDTEGQIIGARHGITGDFGITVDNSGQITGNLGSGINLDNAPGENGVTTSNATNTVITNEATGVISGTGGTNGDGSAQDGDAVDVDYTVTLKNYGHINAHGAAVGTGDDNGALQEAVTVGGGEIDNYAGGVIQSVQRAITVDNSNDGNAYAATIIYNEGDIRGVDSAADNNLGAISITDDLGDTLTNKGTIEGSIQLGDGANTINLYTGSSISGALHGGSGADTLNLMGSGEGSLAATPIANVENLNIDGGDWEIDSNGFTNVAFGSGAHSLTLDADALKSGQFSGTITGFEAGDAIKLTGFDASTTTVNYNSSTDVLTVTDGQNHSEKFTLSGVSAGEYFHPEAATNGVDVIENGDPACYCRGTMILTDKGEVAVESLAIGDMVVTAAGAAKAVRWLGIRAVSSRFADPVRAYPVRVRANAIDDNVPARDLLVSPDHALLIDGNLIQAGALVNGTSIVREKNVPETFNYYHVELAEHDLILAENAPAETFVDNVDRMGFDNWAEHEALYPEGEPMVEMPHPRAKAHRQVPKAAKERLSQRAATLTLLGERRQVA